LIVCNYCQFFTIKESLMSSPVPQIQTVTFAPVTFDPSLVNPQDNEPSLPLFYMSISQINDLTPDEAKNMLVILNNCNCCKRHTLRKPKKYKPWNMPSTNKWNMPSSKESDSIISCQCCCRQTARFICRNCPE
jgi:hypothetical protein